MNTEITDFIDHFSQYEKTTDTFQFGCCYWFAFILFSRFRMRGAKIMYDEVENHFGTMVGNMVYDITGDVTKKYTWVPWDKLDDSLLRERIIKDCIMF